MHPSKKQFEKALQEALVRHAATIPTEAWEALARVVAAFPVMDAADVPEFVQKQLTRAMVNRFASMVEEWWLASHGNLASEGEKTRRRFEEGELEKLRSSPERFAAAIEPMRSADRRAISDAWEAFREGIAVAFGSGMAMSVRVVAERGQEENRVKALAQTTKLMKAIKEVCKARGRKLSPTKQCANEIRADVKSWLRADLKRREGQLDKTDRKINALIERGTWPSIQTIITAISKLKAAEKAGSSSFPVNNFDLVPRK